MLKPLIKWPGGKTNELDRFLSLIPSYDRYIEPFVGGGALYFYLNRLVKEQDQEFKRILNLYCSSFERLKEQCAVRYQDILALYRLYEEAQKQELDICRLGLNEGLVRRIGEDPEIMTEQLRRMTEDKILRTIQNGKKKPLTDRDLKNNLMTGFTSGFYMYFRNVFNEIAAGELAVTLPYRIANFYFIREYCYGAMFRYNHKGEFNIPYGGISYNGKDFGAKIRTIFGEDVARLLGRTEIYCEDFESFLDKLTLTERDFLFLDPPYDTDFSEYEGKDFDKNDQKRLADFLKRTRARFLLVLKNTGFIYGLYENCGFRILSFDNRYLYNMRSRNDRSAQHLLITNIPEEEIPWKRENFLI